MTGSHRKHLEFLAVLHYVLAGITALVGLFPVRFMLEGMYMLGGHYPGRDMGNPQVAGWITILLSLIITVLIWGLALVMLGAGHCLIKRRHFRLCMIAAFVECVVFPVGTLLGASTILTLRQPRTRQLFGLLPRDHPSLAPRN